jgi:hypothetical protein
MGAIGHPARPAHPTRFARTDDEDADANRAAHADFLRAIHDRHTGQLPPDQNLTVSRREIADEKQFAPPVGYHELRPLLF